MNLKYRYIFILLIVFLPFFYYKISFIKSQQSYISHININQTFKKISIAYYTTLYGIRTDSSTKIFNDNLNQICHILNPEEYTLADSVFVSIVDVNQFPISYRNLHQSQLWVFHSEESPRNSYKTVQMNDITELDDWFNLTATLKPESDFHIQYRGYRIKPEIGDLIRTKLNESLDLKFNISSDIFQNDSSIYLNSLSSILSKELQNQQNFLSKTCPYTCNQPLSSNIIQFLQPYLKPIETKILNDNIVYIAWFVSNCNTHSDRESYVKQLRSQKGIHIDIYGKCKSIFQSPIVPMQCQKGTPNCIEKTLSNYRFYLSFENSKCDTYITEKYWIHGLNRHAIPIVLGAKKEQYQRIAVPNSYIHVDDYQTIEDLANELHRLNKNQSEYVKYLQWTQLYDVSVEYKPTAGMDIHSTLCLLGHYQYLYSIKEQNRQIDYLMNKIRMIFNITNIYLPNFNWLTAKTNLIRISQFYNPKVNCWDKDYPSILKQMYNYLFMW